MSGTEELASLENDPDRLRISNAADVVTARAELLAKKTVLDRIVQLNRWAMAFPQATSQLLNVIARDPSASLDLAPVVLGTRVIEAEDADNVLVTAFPLLRGVWREAAADRPGVQERCGISPDPGTSVPAPDPSWLWPLGKPFPPGDTIAGIQARLNHLGIGAGPVDGRWTELTRRAYTRWQVLSGLPPTGDLEDGDSDHLAAILPDSPE